LGAIPEDKLLRAVRLDEVQTALNAEFMFGSKVQLDQVCCVLVCQAPSAAARSNTLKPAPLQSGQMLLVENSRESTDNTRGLLVLTAM
jgi:hypothetical protein